MMKKPKKQSMTAGSISGDGKLSLKFAGIPARKITHGRLKLKSKVAEIKDLKAKGDEFQHRNELVQGLKQKGCELKILGAPMNAENVDFVDDDVDDLDEAEESEDDPSKEESEFEEDDNNLAENETETEDVFHDDVLAGKLNGNLGLNDSVNEIERCELENIQRDKAKLNEPSCSKNTTANPPNEQIESVAGEKTTGKSRQSNLADETLNGELENIHNDQGKLTELPIHKKTSGKTMNDGIKIVTGEILAGKSCPEIQGDETNNTQLGNDLLDNTKLMEASVSKNVAVKRTNELVKELAGKNGGRVNSNLRPRDSGDLRTRHQLGNTPYSTTKLYQPSMGKNNNGKPSNDRLKVAVGSHGVRELGILKNGRKNTISDAGIHQQPSGKMIQGPISRATASINKNEIPRNSDDHDAVSNLDNEEDVVEEGCDADSSDDDTTILEVFDALGSKNEETAKKVGETGSKVLPVLANLPKPTPEAKKSFAQLFKAENAKKNGYKLQYVCKENQDEDLKFEDEDVKETSQVWGHSLIGYIAGKNPSYKAVIGYCKGWTHKCRVHFDASGWIVVKFEKEEDLMKVLEGGPYLIYGKPFIIKKMPKYFCFDKSEICKAQVWITLPHLPLELWNEKALSKIGSRVGEPIQVDSITATMERASFARLLVEVDLSEKLIDDIPLILPNGKRIVQEVHYEYVPAYCEDCKAIGHDTKMCARRRKQLEESKSKDVKKDLVGATAGVAPKPNAAPSESVSLEVSTIPTFDASSSKPSKDQNLEKIVEDSEEEFVEYLSKNRKKAVAKGKRQVGKEDFLDIERIGAGINKAASRWQRKTNGPNGRVSSGIEPSGRVSSRVEEPCRPNGNGNGEPIGIEPIEMGIGSNVEMGSTSCVVDSKVGGTALVDRDQRRGGNLPRPSR